MSDINRLTTMEIAFLISISAAGTKKGILNNKELGNIEESTVENNER